MRRRILVVDDSVISLATVEQKLKDKYDIVSVNSGSRALQYLRTEKPDLILLDIKMADKDGIETLKEIRELDNGADIPVIMLTSKSDKYSVFTTHNLGICDYVLKPFETEVLRDRIERVLHEHGKF